MFHKVIVFCYNNLRWQESDGLEKAQWNKKNNLKRVSVYSCSEVEVRSVTQHRIRCSIGYKQSALQIIFSKPVRCVQATQKQYSMREHDKAQSAVPLRENG